MANPIDVIASYFEARDAAGTLPAGATFSQRIPDAGLTVHHFQYAWDGTPTDADNREDAAVRITVWGPKSATTATQDLAGQLRRDLLATTLPGAWRVDRGAGRLPGRDPATQLPFCSFTLQLVVRLDPVDA